MVCRLAAGGVFWCLLLSFCSKMPWEHRIYAQRAAMGPLDPSTSPVNRCSTTNVKGTSDPCVSLCQMHDCDGPWRGLVRCDGGSDMCSLVITDVLYAWRNSLACPLDAQRLEMFMDRPTRGDVTINYMAMWNARIRCPLDAQCLEMFTEQQILPFFIAQGRLVASPGLSCHSITLRLEQQDHFLKGFH